jgi:site-specific DNA recombinase
MPTASAHKIPRQPIYMGGFEWAGKMYNGSHEPLVARDLWEHVQNVLDLRLAKREKKTNHDFAFSSLVSCGHCGCALVGELKKGRHVYYHCSGYKGKCPERFFLEEKLKDASTPRCLTVMPTKI